VRPPYKCNENDLVLEGPTLPLMEIFSDPSIFVASMQLYTYVHCTYVLIV